MPSLPSDLPVELGSVQELDAQLSRLHRLAVAGGPSWSLARLLRRGISHSPVLPELVVILSLPQRPHKPSHDLSTLPLPMFPCRSFPNPSPPSLFHPSRCLNGSTPVHAGAFSGRSQVMAQLLQAGGDLCLHDQQGHTPRDWAEQGGVRQSREVAELLQLCRTHMSALLNGGELAPFAALGPLYAGSGHGLCGSLSSLIQAESTLHHPNLLPLMALSPSADLAGLCLLFEPVWLGSLHVMLHPPRWKEKGPGTVPGLLPGHMLLQVLEALLFLQAHGRAHGSLSSHAVHLVRPGLAKVGNLEHGRPLNQPCLRPRLQQGYPWGGPGIGLPPPPELYPWLPLELIHGDTPATTSDLYSFCILAQEVFTGELPWAGREGLEVKDKLEAGESPALDPLVPTPYQALVRAGLGLGPTDLWGSLQSTRYLLREAVAQVWVYLSEQKYNEVAHRAKTMPRLVHPGPIPSQSPSVYFSLQDSASQTQSVEQFEKKFLVQIPALSAHSFGFPYPATRADKAMDPKAIPCPIPPSQTHSSFLAA
ncbi:Testis-expressed protein 14 [Fukomys damarensis]|uniref:Testis-expressed protein 14 n=1 Tax=Fukomys damarensis TaxID=885580 RepID=A0A091DIC7_FUKDA|nr:Testis-expressed protein 14 [Fukomys damarensis]